jgi:putative hemolysin
MDRLSRVPAVGDKFQWSGLCFEVSDMDRNRVDRVLVMRLRIGPDPEQ